jgi:hypothetical protein
VRTTEEQAKSSVCSSRLVSSTTALIINFPASYGEIPLYYGLPAVFESYEGITCDPLGTSLWEWEDDDAAGFLSDPLNLIRQERGQSSQQSSSSGGPTILKEVIGEHDKCRHCDVRKGLQLWNETSKHSNPHSNVSITFCTDWDDLLGILNADVHRHLPGRLPYNISETKLIRDTLKDIRYSAFLAGLFTKKEAPFDTLTEQDWLCLDCVLDFIHHHLFKWWLDHKREGQFSRWGHYCMILLNASVFIFSWDGYSVE